MTLSEAQTIYTKWQDYIEVADKLHAIFTVVPEAFLPYPVETLEEALNIIAKRRFDLGDKKSSKDIQELMVMHLGGYYTGKKNGKLTAKEVIFDMQKTLKLLVEKPELLEYALKRLNTVSESWKKFNEENTHE